MLNIVIPMAGKGSRFQEAGYAFPKPLIDIYGKTMIEIVIKNLNPRVDHKFIFICQKEHYEKYDLYNIFKNTTKNNFEVIQINGITEGAACTVLCAKKYINDENPLLIANSDQYIETDINSFIDKSSKDDLDGNIMTFESSHPKWSYVRLNSDNLVLETAEKKVISNEATVGIYYFKEGKDFVEGAENMIKKNIKSNNEFYVCPVYNELILKHKKIATDKIQVSKIHGLGTPEDLNKFIKKLDEKEIVL